MGRGGYHGGSTVINTRRPTAIEGASKVARVGLLQRAYEEFDASKAETKLVRGASQPKVNEAQQGKQASKRTRLRVSLKSKALSPERCRERALKAAERKNKRRAKR